MPRTRNGTPRIEYAKGTGVAYVHWYDEKAQRSRRRSLNTTDPVQARQKLGAFLVNGEADPKSGRVAGLTVAQTLDDYWNEHGKTVADAERQEIAIRHLKAFFGPRKEARDLTVDDCRSYTAARGIGAIGGRRASGGFRPGSTATCRRELNVLVAALDMAVRRKRLPKFDAPDLELPTVEESTETKWLGKDVIRRLLASVDGELHDFCKIAYYTAARRASIEDLTVAQVDLRVGVIHLQREGARKTKKRRPTVPLYKEIRPNVERLLIAAQKRGDGRLFAKRNFYREFVAAALDIQVEAWPHMLRHSRATHMLMDGEDIYKVARLLGDTPTTVQKTYAHATTEFLQTESSLEM